MNSPRRHRANITVTLSQDALDTLDDVGGPGNRAAAIDALLAALRAGEVPSFAPRLAVVLAARTSEAADRARVLRKKSTPHRK